MAELNRKFGEKVLRYVDKHTSVFGKKYSSCDSITYDGVKVHDGEECAECRMHTPYEGYMEWFIPVKHILIVDDEKELLKLWKDDAVKHYPKMLKELRCKIHKCNESIGETKRNLDSLRSDLLTLNAELETKKAELAKYENL